MAAIQVRSSGVAVTTGGAQGNFGLSAFQPDRIGTFFHPVPIARVPFPAC
jgi:hypothetical protein